FDSEEPKDQETKISFACRCSMAIPYFFKPERINGEMVFDGGMQNNYPVRALLEKEPALRENLNFIGLYLGPKTQQVENQRAWRALVSIATEASDEEAKNEFIDNTIVIDPQPVETTDFSLSPTDVRFLIAEGKASALQWLSYHSQGNRPTEAEIESARQKAAALRTLTTNERNAERKRARRNLSLKFLFGLALVAAIIG